MQSPVHVSVHAFESLVKRNQSRYEDDARKAVAEAGGNYTPLESQSDELKTYLDTIMVLPSEGIDILQWWKQHENNF